MKTATAGMKTMLASNNEFFIADLYTFTLLDGTIYRYTSGDGNLTISGNVFDSASLILKRSSISLTIGLQVDTLTIIINPKDGDTMASKPFLKALVQGNIDGATVRLERAIMTTYGDTTNGILTMFVGRISDIAMSRTVATLSVKSMIELLNVQIPKNLYSLSCIHSVYDDGCTLLKSSFATTATVTTATAGTINFTDAKATGYYDQGMIEFTSGLNIGLKRTVKTHVNGSITLSLYLPNIPLVGDTFTLYAGCDRTQATCSAKFSNLSHFRGYPYIPAPEVIV